MVMSDRGDRFASRSSTNNPIKSQKATRGFRVALTIYRFCLTGSGAAFPDQVFFGSRRITMGTDDHFIFSISAVIAGTTSNRSPTIPKSHLEKMGASGSLLMATTTRDEAMPAKC